MLKRTVIAVVLLAALLDGCGSTRTVTETVISGSGTSSATVSGGQCKSLSTQPPSGTVCTINGVVFHFARENVPVRLKTITVEVTGAAFRTSFSNAAFNATPKGIFIEVTVKATDDGDSPATFDETGDQVEIIGHGSKQYTENTDAEEADNNSCSDELSSGPIQPGESDTCNIDFDVPLSEEPYAQSRGVGFAVSDFGRGVTSDSIDPEATEAALIFVKPTGAL